MTRGRSWAATLLLAAAALALYLALRQDVYYAADAQGFVWAMNRGEWSHPRHVLYPHWLWLVQQALAPIGLTNFQIAGVASALGTALGVAGCHRAALGLGAAPARAALVAGLVALAPATVFFATVVEAHGPFWAAAGLAWWAFARLVERPAGARAVLAGGATGLATGMHATGHLLAPALGLLFLAWGRGDRWRHLRLAAALLLAHGLTFVVLARTLGGSVPLGATFGFLAEGTDGLHHAGYLPFTLWHEWLHAFAPVSLAFVLGRPGRLVLALAGCVAAFLVATLILVGPGSERGAYLLPLAFPAAWLALTRASLAGAVAMLVVAGALAVAAVRVHDRPVAGAGMASDFRAATVGTKPFLLLAPKPELEAVLNEWQEAECASVFELAAGLGRDPAGYPALCQAFDALVRERIAAGRSVFVSAAALALLSRPESPATQRLVREHLDQRYRREPRAHGAVELQLLTPR